MATLTDKTVANTYDQLWFRGATQPGATDNAVQVLTTENDGTDDLATPLYLGTARIGIGTSSPTVELDVTGATAISGALTVGGNIDFNSGTIDTSTQTVTVELNQAANSFTFDGQNDDILSVDGANNRVGIGTAEPATPLHVVQGNVQACAKFENEHANGCTIQIENDDGSGGDVDTGFITVDGNGGAGKMSLGFIGGAPHAQNLNILANGNVGIGTAAPESTLSIFSADATTIDTTPSTNSNTGSDYGLFIQNSSNVQYSFAGIAFDCSTEVDNNSTSASIAAVRMQSGTASHHNASLTFNTNDGDVNSDQKLFERMRIQDDGNVGIGTTSPATELEIGDIDKNSATVLRLSTNANYDQKIEFANSPNPFVKTAIVAEGTNSWHRSNLHFIVDTAMEHNDYTLGTDTKMFIAHDTGYVGIGTAEPEHALHVITSGQAEDGIIKVGGSGADLGLEIEYDQSSATAAKITCNPTYTNTGALLYICVDGDANANQLVLKGDGNVGIGTTSPGAALHVAPDNNNNDGDIKVGTRGWFSHRDASTTKTWIANDYNSDSATFGIRMKGVTDGDEKLTILGSGNVGIGTTTPDTLLEISGAGAVVTSTITCYSDDGAHFPALYLRKADGTEADPDLVANNDVLGVIYFQGLDADSGGSYMPGAAIIARVDGTPTDDQMPCELEFWTNTGDNSGTKNLTIAEDGGIFAYNLAGASAVNDVVEWNAGTKELYHETSDASLKENFKVIPYGLAEINQLNPCMYDMYSSRIDTNEEGQNTGTYTKSESPESFGAIGMVAQEVGEVMPKLVTGDVLKNYKNRELMTVMVKAIQELSAEVEKLKNG